MKHSQYLPEVFPNAKEVYHRLQALKKVLPIVEELKKSHKNRFKKNKSAEKNNLLNALYEIHEKNVTDEDFDIAEAIDDDTGEIVGRLMIEGRLAELGWEK